jgi:DNA-binding NarL/FixJ family response regulator
MMTDIAVQACYRQRHRLLLLTPREVEVLWLMMHGYRAKDIASASYVSLATARTQIASILSKLGCTTQLEAVAATYALMYGEHDRSAFESLVSAA